MKTLVLRKNAISKLETKKIQREKQERIDSMIRIAMKYVIQQFKKNGELSVRCFSITEFIS